MKLTAGQAIDEFVELRFKEGSWEKNGIPREGCWIRQRALDEVLTQGAQYNADLLIHGLMDWLDVTDDPDPARHTLRLLLDRHYPPDGRTDGTCRFVDEHGVVRTFFIGPVDPAGDVIAWQRGTWIAAMAQASSTIQGRMIVSAPGPISHSVAKRILALSLESYMGAPFDSYQGAVSMSGSTSNFYALERGEMTTCHWLHGVGNRMQNDQIVDCSHELQFRSPGERHMPNQVAMMVAIANLYSDDGGFEIGRGVS